MPSVAAATPSSAAPWAADVITLVPAFWRAALGPDTGLLGQAFARGLAHLRVTCLRDFGAGRHRQVDDLPYGGGAGMVLTAPPIARALEHVRERQRGPLVALTPRGRRLDQATARQLAAGPGAIFLCGRYEGIDERLLARADLEISVGDLVLTGGDAAALCLVDAAVRLLPGVLGNAASLLEESFAVDCPGLEHPHYTRPAVFEGEPVPAVLRSGDHAAIARWRREAAQASTAARRPDLLVGAATVATAV